MFDGPPSPEQAARNDAGEGKSTSIAPDDADVPPPDDSAEESNANGPQTPRSTAAVHDEPPIATESQESPPTDAPQALPQPAQGVQPEAGRWVGVIEGGEFAPLLVEFDIADDGKTVYSLVVADSEISSGWTAVVRIFTKARLEQGRLIAAQDGGNVELVFVSNGEAHGKADVPMEFLMEPDLASRKSTIRAGFVARPRRLLGGVLGAGENPLVGTWRCSDASLDTVTLIFKADGTGSAATPAHIRSFDYLYDPKSKRVDIDGVQGDCTLTDERTLTADLQFTFIDVLGSPMNTILVDVQGAFTPE